MAEPGTAAGLFVLDQGIKFLAGYRFSVQSNRGNRYKVQAENLMDEILDDVRLTEHAKSQYLIQLDLYVCEYHILYSDLSPICLVWRNFAVASTHLRSGQRQCSLREPAGTKRRVGNCTRWLR